MLYEDSCPFCPFLGHFQLQREVLAEKSGGKVELSNSLLVKKKQRFPDFYPRLCRFDAEAGG